MKMKRKRVPRSLAHWWGLAVLLAIIGSGTYTGTAQIATTTASLAGMVTDPSGAVVPGASVILTSTERGLTRAFTTDSAGRYAFSQLPPATYSLAVKATGFQKYQQNGIALNAAQSASQDIKLSVGAESQSVIVTADASLLNTENSNVATDLSASQIAELPLNTRNVYGLVSLNSSVSNTSEGQMLLGGGTNTTDDADQDISFMNFAGG